MGESSRPSTGPGAEHGTTPGNDDTGVPDDAAGRDPAISAHTPPAGEPAAKQLGRRLTAQDLGLPPDVTCPFCDHDDTDLHAPFGSALSVATYWCNRCRTAFEWVKWGD